MWADTSRGGSSGVLLALFGTVALLTGASADEPPGPDAAADTRERAVTLLRNGVSDPDKLRHSFAVRYTENGQELELGDGVWGPANAVGEYELYFADPQAGQAGFFGIVEENSHSAIVALRLKIENRPI